MMPRFNSHITYRGHTRRSTSGLSFAAIALAIVLIVAVNVGLFALGVWGLVTWLTVGPSFWSVTGTILLALIVFGALGRSS